MFEFSCWGDNMTTHLVSLRAQCGGSEALQSFSPQFLLKAQH